MAKLGHFYGLHDPDDAHGGSSFRVFAPGKRSVAIVLPGQQQTLALTADASGHWHGSTGRLPPGTRYWIEADGRRVSDPASRCQPEGVHGPSMVAEVTPAQSPGWAGVAMADAVIYELHLGTFTHEGTLAAAQQRLAHLRELGVNAVELLPIASFPGERNWGYDGTHLFALHAAYGTWADLKAFIEAAHAHGIAVLNDVVYNHFGPEGNYSGVLAPYAHDNGKAAATPWGAAINFDGPQHHGVREFFLENLRFWLQDVGFDGLRMDAVSLVFDDSPVHILREFTDLARAIGQAEGREVLLIAEHLRNDRFVVASAGTAGYGYHAQWNDDLNHAVFALLTGETQRHYANFGSFDDVVKALQSGFVLDGTRFDRVHRRFLGSDGRLTQPSEHVVHIQDHDQVGNRLHGDRMIARYGAARALLGITAVMASPFVPMLFMGEEYGETAPFFFFEDFSDAATITGAREGRKAEFAYGGVEPPDPHARSTFERSKLQWQRAATPEGQRIFAYYRGLIALKRAGALGPRAWGAAKLQADAATRVIRIETAHTLTWMNFSDQPQPLALPPEGQPLLCSTADPQHGVLAAHGAVVCGRRNRA